MLRGGDGTRALLGEMTKAAGGRVMAIDASRGEAAAEARGEDAADLVDVEDGVGDEAEDAGVRDGAGYDPGERPCGLLVHGPDGEREGDGHEDAELDHGSGRDAVLCREHAVVQAQHEGSLDDLPHEPGEDEAGEPVPAHGEERDEQHGGVADQDEDGKVFVPVARGLELRLVLLDAEDGGDDGHQEAEQRVVKRALVQPYREEKRTKQQAADADDGDEEEDDTFRKIVEPAQQLPVLAADQQGDVLADDAACD